MFTVFLFILHIYIFEVVMYRYAINIHRKIDICLLSNQTQADGIYNISIDREPNSMQFGPKWKGILEMQSYYVEYNKKQKSL